MADSNTQTKAQEEILLSKRMFMAGCLGLPWLWICNALYFRSKVFGPMVMVDYWPGKSPPPPTSDDNVGGDSNNADDNDDDDGETMERQLERQMEKNELEKWVRRSTRGAVLAMTLFVSWIVAFQVNKEHFGPRWFVMDPTDAETSGW